MPESDGPYLSYAVLCEKVLREADDVMSFIRIVDHVTVTVTTAVPAGADVPVPGASLTPLISLAFAVGLKSGGYVGPVPVKVRIEPPSGTSWPEFDTVAILEGPGRGAALIIPLQFPAQDEGLYWFAVEISGELATRIPLRVTLQTATHTIPIQQD